MRILFCSITFPPNIGGIETVSSLLADQFSRLGASVTVVTKTPGESSPPSGLFEIVRTPSLKRLLELGQASDLIFQNNISLKTLLPLLPLRKPIVVAHHTWLARASGKRGWQDYAKIAVLPLCHNIAISRAVASALPVNSTVILNPFDSAEFASLPETPRIKDIVFLGRLVSDKGCDLAIRALAALQAEGLRPSLSVIGDGPELPKLRGLADLLGVSEQVSFLGSIREGRGQEVARHRIMVIPSRWAEPFGLVALEGLAAGCAIVASSAGGLPEAVGPCGCLFPNGDASALSLALRNLLTDSSLRQGFQRQSAKHLQQFQPAIVAQQYLSYFDRALRN